MQADRVGDGSALARVPEGVRSRLLAAAQVSLGREMMLMPAGGDRWLATADQARALADGTAELADTAAARWLAGLDAMALVPQAG